MPLSVIIGPGYNFSDGEKVTYTKLNMLGSPAVTFTGSIDSNQITDGAVLTSKLSRESTSTARSVITIST